jgi:hypothetical protein
MKSKKREGWIVGPELPNAHALNPWGFSTLEEKEVLIYSTAHLYTINPRVQIL